MPNISKLATFSIFSLRTKPISSFSSSSSPLPLSTSPVPTHEHISHLILEQKSASKALETFRWASKLSSFTHSQSTYRALIHKLCNFRRFDIVRELLDEMPNLIGSPPNEDIFITIIRGFGRARMIRQVIGVLDLISNFETTPSLKVLNSILDVLVKEDIDVARKFYRKKMMGIGVQGDDYTFGILMKGLCLTNRIGDGFKLLQMMKTRGIAPNTVIYNTLIHALCKNGKVGRARSLMSEIKEPNDVTFNVIVSAYCNEGRLIQALVLLEKCFSLGFVPDIITVTKVLEILCNEGRAKEAVEILERVESKGGAVDALAYNTIMKGFCKLGKLKIGLQFLNVMESKGCLPNADTYNVLLNGFCGRGMLDSALDLFNDMKMDGIGWNFVTFDTLIRGLCSGGRMEDGFKILELMVESKRGSGGSISPYNSVLYGLYKKHQAAEALEFLTKMKNLFPRAVDRNLAILEFCEGSDIDNAKRVYDQMTGEGGAPSCFVYDRLIRGFCQEGCMREAIEIMNEMVGCGYIPVASTFNDIISEFCKQGKVGSALKFMEDMVRRGCIPDTDTYKPLLFAFSSNGDFQNSLRLFQQMVEKSILPDYCMWDSMLFCMVSRQTAWSDGKNMFHVHNIIESIIPT